MTLLLDAAPLIAAADAVDPLGAEVRNLLQSASGPMVIPAPVTAEVDYLLGARLGRRARWAFLDDIADGRFRVEALDVAGYARALALEKQYADLGLGLADASLVVLAERFNLQAVVTFDQRHFRAIRPAHCAAFKLLPFDLP